MGSIFAIPVAIFFAVLAFKPSDIPYYVKWLVAYVHVWLSRRSEEKRMDFYDMDMNGDAEKTNFINPTGEYVVESPVPQSTLLKAKDEVFFWGTNSQDELLTVSLRRRGGNSADTMIHLRLNGKAYRLEQKAGPEQTTTDRSAYSCGGLQVYFTNPMRRWRLFYNGFLREVKEDGDEGTPIYVKFSLAWRASSDVFDFLNDVPSCRMSSILAHLSWNGFQPPLESLKKSLNFYGQSGTIHGTVSVGDDSSPQEVYLYGQRMKFFDGDSKIKGAKISHILGRVAQNGSYANLGVVSSSAHDHKQCFGFLMEPDSTIWPVMETEITARERTSTESSVFAKFVARNRPYKLKGTISEVSIGDPITHKIEFDLNGRKGTGLILQRNESQGQPAVATLTTLKPPEVVPLTVTFSDLTCQISEVTGGKGSSLGKLTQFSKKLQTFIVPNGIVVTTESYKVFTTKETLEKIKILEDVLYENKPGDVKEACNMVSNAVVDTYLPEKISLAIVSDLRKVFGANFDRKKFAVRSSATGEDTEQMSAAGQMETFLGVMGENEILLAVKKCWASQFGYIAVQYKRRYGQILNSPMAVVIQEMVSCDRAGVLFTCDPLTGNPTVMTITANYGLGESVVSGSEEPDTITLQRDADDQLTISSKAIGAKSRRMVVKEDEGTALEDVPEAERENCSLTDSEAMRLGQLAVKVEKLYRSSRDIEWGFYNNNLYIFQSRPVTSGSQENDFDIDHEFDGSLLMENEYFSISNVGEVMPGAFTPLGYQLFYRVIGSAFQKKNPTEYDMNSNKYFTSGMMIYHNHAMFNILEILRIDDTENLDAITKSTLIAFFGRILDDKDLYKAIGERFGDKPRPKSFYRVAKLMLTANRMLTKTMGDYFGYRIPVEKYAGSKQAFKDLLGRCSDFHEAFLCHMVCTQSSSIWNLILMTILGKAHGDFDDVIYRDFANLLTAISDVESADVPSAMQSLAYHISKSIPPEEFKKKNVQEAREWLQESNTSAGKKYRQFLEKHGHRCLKEFEIRTVTWGTNPDPLVKHLQNLAGNVSEDASTKKSDSINDIISKLKVPLGFVSRLIIKVLLPFSRSAVQAREKSKSLIIKCMDHWRRGFCRLAQLMVSEGRLPEADLLFFLTLEDIRELLDTRSPSIIAKAYHRRKRYPVLDKYMFPEIMKGRPVPINMDVAPSIPSDENLSMKGIPVSQGVVQGFVRVALTLQEADALKPGEILLTHGTDIGWTPYFPTLAGVVTELGGLISHGAVVSREYGIPCIAGLHGATRMFQTGDYVQLDGNKGILQKLPPPSS